MTLFFVNMGALITMRVAQLLWGPAEEPRAPQDASTLEPYKGTRYYHHVRHCTEKAAMDQIADVFKILQDHEVVQCYCDPTRKGPLLVVEGVIEHEETVRIRVPVGGGPVEYKKDEKCGCCGRYGCDTSPGECGPWHTL